MALGIKNRMQTPLRSPRMGQMFTSPATPAIACQAPMTNGACPPYTTQYRRHGGPKTGGPRDICVNAAPSAPVPIASPILPAPPTGGPAFGGWATAVSGL